MVARVLDAVGGDCRSRSTARHALDIRKSIITATVKSFQPQLFIVDKEALGLKREVLPALQWLRRCRPKTRTILGLRDIMDDAPTTQLEWQEKGVYQILEELYSEIWVYGNRELYDPIHEYQIGDAVSSKIHFTGYIPRKVPAPEGIQSVSKEHGLQEGEKLVVVTTGGGGDGFGMMDTYLRMLESKSAPAPFKSILITGPFMPKSERKNINKRSRKLGVRMFHFYRQMEKIFAAADVVVSMGGYNTLCEILTQRTVSLVVPRETPRQEQMIRAQTFKRKNLIDYIPSDDLAPELLRRRLLDLIDEPQIYREAVAQFRNLLRAIHLREGRKGKKDDYLPESQFTELDEPVYDVFGMFNPDLYLPGRGDEVISRKGKALSREVFEAMRDEYYRLRGWDAETGFITRKKLLELGLEDIIESLQEKEFIDFYAFLVRRKTKVTFPIKDKKELERWYRDYKQEYGSIHQSVNFFKSLTSKNRADLIKNLKVTNTLTTIENLSRYLYEVRSKFVHEAELIINISGKKTLSRYGKKGVVCELSLNRLMELFEEGLVIYFKKT